MSRQWWILALALLAMGCGSSSTSHPGRSAHARLTPTQRSTTAKPPPRPPLPPANNGSLPQTRQRPSSGTATFRAEMAALWRGVQSSSVHAALPAFFPPAAYAQVKAISNARADWRNRLVGNYTQDLAAAHRLLDGDASRAQLTQVDVPAQLAHWVPPGSCYNRLGYWEVPNSRVVYRVNGKLRSFGIASLISWRGYWYVVHLGSVTAGGGTVDDPQPGKGSSAPSSTC